MLAGRHLIQPDDLTVSEIEEICSLAEQIIVDPKSFQDVCRGKILATLFFEPSTRTRLSFEAAMLRLGGSVEGFSDAENTSSVKGETLADTIRVVSSYADVIAMRTPKEGAALLASKYSACPIINAGDGGHYHPTQTLTDLVTIRQLLGGLENHTVGFCGDLKFGRTVHSLITAMARYKNIKFILISPKELTIPEYLKKEVLEKHNIEYCETENIEEYMGELDVLYMTRVQKERFFNEEDYLRLKDTYILSPDKLDNAKEDLIILHPLPRVNEISVAIDDDKRACYFKQVKNAKMMRMALILKLLKEASK
jgi:aspartate carbamoyltransferase catalytic subunit